MASILLGYNEVQAKLQQKYNLQGFPDINGIPPFIKINKKGASVLLCHSRTKDGQPSEVYLGTIDADFLLLLNGEKNEI